MSVVYYDSHVSVVSHVPVVKHACIVLATGRYYYRKHHHHHNHNLLHNLIHFKVLYILFLFLVQRYGDFVTYANDYP